ncbi:MAG: WD40 repeat domain-containing protein [Planctomycetota bacterium]
MLLNKDRDTTEKSIQERLQSYKNELDGFLQKDEYASAEERAMCWNALEESWYGPIREGNPLEAKFQKISQGKRIHYKNLLQQKKGPLNSNQTSEKFAEIYVGDKDFLAQEGKIHFCYGKWWTEEEARNRGYLIVRIDNSVYHKPDQFFFKDKLYIEEEVQKYGLAFKHNDRWLTPAEAENEGYFYVASQVKWLTGKDAVNEGCLYFEEETKRYLSRKQANKIGIFYDNEFTHQWYLKEEAQKRGLALRHAGQWLTREEAQQKGFAFVRTDRQFGEWKDRDELWLGGIDKTLIHDQAKQQFLHIDYVATHKWLVGYDKIGQLKIWDTSKPIPEEIRTVFNVPREVQALTYDIKSSQIITISPAGIFGYQEQGEVMKATTLKYNNVESSAIDNENDLVLALMHPQEAVILKIRARKPSARYLCKLPENYNKSEFSHIALSDDGRSLVAVTRDKEFFIFYFDGNMGSSAEVTGTLILLDEFKMTQQERTIRAIATINREYMAISFAEEPYEVEVWNIDKRSKRKILKAHQAPVTSISFGNNSESLVTSGEDGKIFLWTIQK